MARKVPAPRTASIVEHVLDVGDASVLDVIDHVLNKGVMVSGDVTLGVAGIDLIYLRLSSILCAADRVLPAERRHVSRRVRRRRPPTLWNRR